MAGWLECPLDEVVGARDGDEILQLGEILWVQLVVLDELGSHLGMLWLWEIVDESLFEVWDLTDKKFGLLDFVNVDQIDTQFKYVELVLEAKFDYASGCINVSAWL